MYQQWPQLKYHPIQNALWTSKEKFVYVPCGRQSGKTELALRRLVRYLPIKKDWPDPRYFYAAPTYNQAERIAWRRLLSLIPPQWIAPNGVNKSELVIRTIFGSELFIVGLDKPQRIEGSLWDGGVIDENSDIKPKTFDLSILPAMVWRNGWTWFIGVPKRFGIGATEYRDQFQAAARGELPDSAAFTWPSSGIVPESYLELCRKKLDVRDFDEQFNAVWLSASGGVFYAFNREYNVRPVTYDPHRPIIVSSDFNVDPMCWIMGHLRGSTFEVFDEIFIRNTNTPEVLNVLLSRYGNHLGGFELYGDASGKSRKTSATQTDYAHIANNEKLKKLGCTMHYDSSNPSKADRFAETNARICDGEGNRHCFIDPRCTRLIHDLEVRTYAPGTREVADSGDTGHMTDALGYFLHKRFPMRIVLQGSSVVGISMEPR